MTFANPAGLALLALAVPIVLLHILKPRRAEQIVSSTFLWRQMDRPVTATAPWQRLTPSWLFFLQLLAVVGLALLVANPSRVSEPELAEHTVFLIDASGSMAAIDGSPDRLSLAIERAIEVRASLPDGGVASVIQVGPVPRVLLTTDDDQDAFDQAVQRVQSTEGAANFERAFALAKGLETPDTPIGFVLVSDGGLTAEQLRLVPSGLTYEPIGSMATNRAVTDLRVEPRERGLHIEVDVENTGGPAATQPLRIDVDGRTVHTAEVSLDRNESTTISVDVGPGDQVEVALEGEDLLGLDDRRWAVTSRRSALSVAIIGSGDPFLVALLDSLDGVTVAIDATLDDYDTRVAAGDLPANVLVFDGVEVPAEPSSPFLAIAPPGGAEGVVVAGSVERPIVSLVRTDDTLLRDVDLSGVGIAASQQLDTTAVDVLVGAEQTPLLVRGRQAGRDFLYLAFAPSASNLPVQVAYPILFDRIISELGGSALPPTDQLVGQPLRLGGGAFEVTDPGGRTLSVGAGDPSPIATRPGFWTIAGEGLPSQVIAVNPDTAESHLATAAAIPSEIRTARPGAAVPKDLQSLRPWIIVAMLVVVAAEWALARTRVGVSDRQWRWGQLLRLLIAVALVAALLDVGFDRGQNRVATVFVLDVSDSMGAAGRADSLEWVRSALQDRPDDALAGVVLFGADARIEALVQRDLVLGRPAVQVDASQTDLASALRLGAAILPDDARRRVVLLSDGRATTGDVASEAARLGEEGVSVDVVLIGGGLGADTAVTAIDAPGFVRDGEAVEVTATVQAGQPGDGAVTLLRDGEIVVSRTVALETGANSVTFLDPAPTPGLHRYEVLVQTANDPVPQNDRSFAPVQVGESRGVLVIEGERGNAATFAAALEAGGTPVTVAGVSAIGGVESLVQFDATVLVDVAVQDLAPSQIDALTGSVRDTGRGLLTIGGLRSYGLGGYLGSELEAVLPVISDVLDPQRRQTVAEVLAIDTSGSMGACHCAEGFGAPNRDLGGITKTDIARAGASRAIQALSASDEVGVLAFDVESRWVLDLQTVPSADAVADGLGMLRADGGTNMESSLETAAIELRASDASLKHIILFSDGFTEPAALARLAEQAGELFENEGITTSVIATGEGAAEGLRPIAVAGGGRFYPGRDLDRIPEIIVEEALVASRNYIVEGEFLPEVTSNDPAVQSLVASPPLFGYVASSTKPTASTLLRIGPDADPLLASWQVGLGTATSWTSDSSQRWSQAWVSWDGYVTFWNDVVRDTFAAPTGDVETRARVQGDTLLIEIDSADPIPDGSQAVARVTTPSGASIEVPLDRVSPNTFAAEVAADEEGVYAVGTSLQARDDADASVSGTALAARSYSFEYRPGESDPAVLERIASLTAGRVDIEAAQAFDSDGLAAGSRRVSLTGWLLLAAALLWPIAVAVSRIALRRGARFAIEPEAADRNMALQVHRARTATASADAPTPDAPAPGPSSPDSALPKSVNPERAPSAPEVHTSGGPPVARPVPKSVNPERAPSAPEVHRSGGDSGDDAEPTSTLDALLARKRRIDPE